VGTNGAGKSSIPLILEEVLFNKNSKGIKKADIPNRHVNNGYDISIDFSVEDDEYKIDVIRKASIKVKLYKNGTDISSHTATNTYKSVEEILGIDFKTFSQIVYQNTNASLQFLTATDTNRKKFLIDLLQLDNYVKYFDVFKELSRTLSSDVSRVQGKIDTINKWLSNNNLESIELLPKLKIEFINEEDEKNLRSLQLEFENISDITKKINQNNLYKNQLESIDLLKAKEIVATYKKESTSFLKESLGTWKSELSHETRMRDKYENLKNSENRECPTCSQDIDLDFVEVEYQEHNKRAQYNSNEIKKIESSIVEKERINAKLHSANSNIEEWEDFFARIDKTLPSQIPNALNLESEIRELKSSIESKQFEIKNIIDRNSEIDRHNTRLSIVQEQTEEFEDELETLLADIGSIEDKYTSVEILKKAFSTNGLLAYKIENLVKDLEELTNEYLAELSDGRFSLEFVVINDKLNVNIDDNGKAVDILALSAGELARVNTSTLLAIRKLMSSISKSRINVLFLDEVTNVLDELGKEKLVETLLKEENLNTYMVSHGWTHPLLDKIEVIKEEEISRLDG
jgi:DNA repair exonuclease SbcCD ATPase subunit